MSDIRKRKGFVYLLVCVVIASFLYAIPTESPVIASQITCHYVQHQNMPLLAEMAFGAYIPIVQPQVSFEALRNTVIRFEKAILYRNPIAKEHAIKVKEEQETEGRLLRLRRYHGFRFLTVILIIFALPEVFVHISLDLFGSSYIELWKNIFYIHWIDGKKDGRLSVARG